MGLHVRILSLNNERIQVCNYKKIKSMATDATGNCYVLMVSVTEDYVDYKTMEIIKVSVDGKVVGTIDISDHMKDRIGRCFRMGLVLIWKEIYIWRSRQI